VSRSDPLQKKDIAEAQPPKSMRPPESGPTGQLWLLESFEEIRLFALLMWRFGRPNGPLSLLGERDGDPDGPFKWDFMMEIDGVLIHVIRSTAGLELRWWGRFVDEETMERFVQHNLELHEADVDAAVDALEEYVLLLNPFARHKNVAELVRDELLQAECDPPDIPPAIGASKETYEFYYNSMHDYFQAVDRQAMHAMHLVSEAAYMAEAYLNLLYAILLRPVVRDSAQLRNEALLRKWKSKIQHLPSECEHIATVPDLGDRRIRDAKWLFDLRNRIAHSYPDLEEMRIGGMWFFKSFPVFPLAAPSIKLDRALNNQLPSKEDALKALPVAEALVAYLRELVDPAVADGIDLLAAAQPLGYNKAKGIYGVPFGRYSVYAIFPGASDTPVEEILDASSE
jgi:hypothetical protein